MFLKILQNSQKRICARVSILIKTYTSAYNFTEKETLAQVFFCEFCEIFKLYYRTLLGNCLTIEKNNYDIIMSLL